MPKPLPPPSPRPDGVTVHSVNRFSKGGRGSRRGTGGAKGRRSKRSWKQRSLIGGISLLLLLLLGVLGAYLYARWRFDQVKKISIAGLTARQGNEPFDILLVGSDSRAFVDNASEASQFGSSAATSGQRSDVIIVARVAPALHEIKLLSIPRDTWVNIPGTSDVAGPNKINAAFNVGPALLIETITQSFGIPISDYAEVGFPGFQGMVNALGGIDLDFPNPVKDAFSDLNVSTTGCQVVSGKEALALVRSRHLYYESDGEWILDGNSDFSRIQRQDAFFQAVIPKLRGVTTSPTGINSLLSAMTGDVTIDKTLTEGTLLNLAGDFHSSNGSPLTSETMPTIATQNSVGSDILVPAVGADESTIRGFLAFGSQSTTTSDLRTPDGQSLPVELSSAESAPITVTTLPNSADPNSVDYNTAPEPWNPKPCSAPS